MRTFAVVTDQAKRFSSLSRTLEEGWKLCDEKKCGTKSMSDTCRRCNGPTHVPSPKSYKFQGFKGNLERFPVRLYGEPRTPLWLWVTAQSFVQRLTNNDGAIEFPYREEEALRDKIIRGGLKQRHADLVFLCMQGIIDGSTMGLRQGRKYELDKRNKRSKNGKPKPTPKSVSA